MITRIIVVLIAFTAIAAAQANPRNDHRVKEVELCDLVRHPTSYDGQMIRVRGHVIFEFEDFSLDDSACHTGGATATKNERGVWLTFGGDEPEIATYCCGSYKRKKGTDFVVGGHKVALVRDAEFFKFFHRIRAQRLRRPDGKECGAECKLYEVTATLTGLFSAASAEGGYGHFCMFHLFSIQQVSQTSSERRLVSFGGIFTCSTETWNSKAEDSSPLNQSLRCKDSAESGCTSDLRFAGVAAHWNDDITRGSMTEAYTDTNGDSIANWVSFDLLTSYFTKASDEHVSVRREHCRPLSTDRGPTAAAVPIACDDYGRSLDEDTARDVDKSLAKGDFPSAWARMAKGAKLLFSTGDQSWRSAEAKSAAWHVVRKQAEQWRLDLDSDLQFDRCRDSSADETPTFVGCRWYSQDGTQTFDVSLLKERHSTPGPQSSPWLITEVNARNCRAVSE